MSFQVHRMSDEELEEERICENCGESYTIAGAYREFEDAFPVHQGYSADLTYDSFCDGEYCGACAVEFCREQMEEPNEFDEDEDEEEEDLA